MSSSPSSVAVPGKKKIAGKRQLPPPDRTPVQSTSAKRKKGDFLRGDSLPTQSFVRRRLTKFSKKVRQEIEEAKSLINKHVDELERQVNQLRDETEVKHRFEEMDTNRRLDRLEKKLSVLPEIKETLNLPKTTSTQPAPQEGREQPEEDVIDFDLGPYEEGLKTDESHHDDEKIQEELRLQNRLLTKNSHEMFVIQHRIEETEKKLDHDPKVKHRVDELKIEKRRLREEEVELKNKIEDLKRQLRHNWEKRQEKGRRGSSTRRERHHSTPGPSHSLTVAAEYRDLLSIFFSYISVLFFLLYLC
ncbi:unnamed protein product [Heligmosomoides polygyrus]|uniref:Lebercilin domain-containing protein n=1 Tax=Heligmosomoides polygyrus TaxID=6339 RepID=A0A183GNC3_HELPZ|nr:unnamed protein product [Heligmosomoides polygyrus]